VDVKITVTWRRLRVLRALLVLLVRLRLLSPERALNLYGAAVWRTIRAYAGTYRINLGPFPGVELYVPGR